MSESPREEIQRLRREVERHEDLYRRKHAPEISDYEFDQIKDRLQELEAAHPHLAGPDLGIGDDRSEGFEQRDHAEPMLSLDNTYQREQFAAFVERLAGKIAGENLHFVVEPKVDGVAISLTYLQGVFTRAVTRGNGFRGDDVTANIALIPEIPRRIKGAPDLLEIRGEVYMRMEEFARLNAEREAAGEPLYANPRNLAAGTVKLLDREEASRRRLSVVCYGLGACRPAAFRTLADFNARLKAWGFPTSDLFTVADGEDGAWKAIERLDDARRALPYPTDGAVVKLDRVDLQSRAGATSKFPHWAVAFKFPPDQAETLLRAISMQVGRTGVITPVAELEPVLLAGSTVSRATLHNADEIARKDIREGDTVRIQKAGEIIPQVLGVVAGKRPKDAQPFDFEGRLRELGLDATRDADEAAYKLRAPSREMRIRRLMHFASKHCLDIEGLGEAVAEQLVDLGLVDAPTDVLSLEPQHWALLDKFKEKSVDNMMAGLEAAKSRELWRAIHALGIPNVGMQTAKDLARHFGTLDAFVLSSIEDYLVYEDAASSKQPLSIIPNIGKNVAESITTHVRSAYGKACIKGIKSSLNQLIESEGEEFRFFNSLTTKDLKGAYIKLTKAASSRLLSDTISAIGEGIDYELASKFVSFSADLSEITSADPEMVCELVEAKTHAPKLRRLAAALADAGVRKLLERTGAPTKATSEEYDYCKRQHRYRNAKVLCLFGITVERDLPADILKKKVQSIFSQKINGKPVNSLAFRLWQAREQIDFARLTIEDAESKYFASVQKYLDEAAHIDESELKGTKVKTATRRIKVQGSRDKTVVVSGKVEGMTRDEAKAHAEKLGYTVVDSISTSVGILAVGSDAGPSKLKKAEKLGIKVVPFEELPDITS